MNSSIENNAVVLCPKASIEVEALNNKVFSFSINSGGEILSPRGIYSWDLGDGTSKSGPELLHEYTVPGTYFITVLIDPDEPKRFPEGFMDTVNTEPIYLSHSLRIE